MIFTLCKLFNVLLFEDALSFMAFSSFSSAVLLQHDRTRSIFTTPVTFMIEEFWKRTWPRVCVIVDLQDSS